MKIGGERPSHTRGTKRGSQNEKKKKKKARDSIAFQAQTLWGESAYEEDQLKKKEKGHQPGQKILSHSSERGFKGTI